YRRPASVFVADFIGESNLIDATVLAVGPTAIRLRLDAGGQELELDAGQVPPDRPLTRGERVALVLRAERVRVVPVDAPASTTILATVAQRSFLGASTRL